MAKILIRASDRRILFFTYDDTISDHDPLIQQYVDRFTGYAELISTPRPPANLKLGAYLNATLTSADPEIVVATDMALDRRRDFVTWLDGEIAKATTPAIHQVPEIARGRWGLYLRMLVMATLHPEAFDDAAQWTLISAAQDATPFAFETFSTDETTEFERAQQDGGLVFKTWWDYAGKRRSLKAHDPTDPLLALTGRDYDPRRGSVVALIPEDEIDRADSSVPGAEQPWKVGAQGVPADQRQAALVSEAVAHVPG